MEMNTLTNEQNINNFSKSFVERGNQSTNPGTITTTIVQSTNPLDAMTEDQLLMQWADLKLKVEAAKATEMEMRRYIVSRAFPEKVEGTNNKDLGNGYVLKAGIKFNYKIAVNNNKLEQCLDRIAKIGNRGNIVAERMISWTPNFLLQEYRLLQDEVNNSIEAKEILKIVNEFLVITDAAPTLEIREPKIKK